MYSGSRYGGDDETVTRRRKKLAQQQQSWGTADKTAELMEVLGEDYYHATGDQHSDLELSMLHQTMKTPGADLGPNGDERPSASQLIQLLGSRDDRAALFALKQIMKRMDSGDFDKGNLSHAIPPLVRIASRSPPDQDKNIPELELAVRFVLHQLCVDESYAITISDVGGPSPLISLITATSESPDFEQSNQTIITNILNAIWLVTCYEGNGDLASYNESQGAVPSILRLLSALVEDSNTYHKRLHSSAGIVLSRLPTASVTTAVDSSIRILLLTLQRLSLLRTFRGGITAAGGIEFCIPVMGSISDVSHRVLAARIIKNLMIDNSLEFVVLSGIQSLCPLLASQNDEEKNAAVEVMLHVYTVRGDYGSLSSDFVSCGGLSLCNNLLQSNDENISRNGLILLCETCKHAPEDYSYLLSQEPDLINGIVRHINSTSTHHIIQCCTAIIWYISHVESLHQTLVNTSFIHNLRRLSKHPNSSISGNALGTLKRLDWFDGLEEDENLFSAVDRAHVIQWAK